MLDKTKLNRGFTAIKLFIQQSLRVPIFFVKPSLPLICVQLLDRSGKIKVHSKIVSDPIVAY